MLPAPNRSTFRFYEELNDLLPPVRRKTAFEYDFDGTPSVKDAIEALGVPHTEVNLILVNGESVDLRQLLRGGVRVSVHPTFERLDIAGLTRLRPAPLRDPRFALDVHLGRLARYLRLAGFDTSYANDYDDATVVRIGPTERRIILTRDVGILKHRAVTHAYWVRNTSPRAQLHKVVTALELAGRIRPFTRCMQCNGTLRDAARQEVVDRVSAAIAREHDRFRVCTDCGRVYWRDSHYDRLVRLLDEIFEGASSPSGR